MNILLVEDNQGDIELMQMGFKRAQLSATLSVVYDAVEAIDYMLLQGKYAGVTRPDLVLLDLNMPRMGGKRFLEVVKQDARLKATPVIILSSSDAPADIRDCYERHANSYIIKPFDPMKFMEMIKQIDMFWGRITELPG